MTELPDLNCTPMLLPSKTTLSMTQLIHTLLYKNRLSLDDFNTTYGMHLKLPTTMSTFARNSVGHLRPIRTYIGQVSSWHSPDSSKWNIDFLPSTTTNGFHCKTDTMSKVYRLINFAPHAKTRKKLHNTS